MTETIDPSVRALIRAEYREMPGMCLTVAQAARLFNIDPGACARALETLVADGTLRTNGREFLARTSGRHAV